MAILGSSTGATTLRRGKLVLVQVILKKDDKLQHVIADIKSIWDSYIIAIPYARNIQMSAAASLRPQHQSVDKSDWVQRRRNYIVNRAGKFVEQNDRRIGCILAQLAKSQRRDGPD